MGQFGFFDAERRLAAITAKGDPLEMIARVVPFESFRAEIEAAVLTPVSEKKSSAGRKPIDVMVMFRMLVLQSLRLPHKGRVRPKRPNGRLGALIHAKSRAKNDRRAAAAVDPTKNAPLFEVPTRRSRTLTRFLLGLHEQVGEPAPEIWTGG